MLHVHGGGYVLYPGEVGAGEAMLMAGYGRFKVISVDWVDAILQVIEGQSHAQFLFPFVPESEEAFAEIARFLAMHLAA